MQRTIKIAVIGHQLLRRKLTSQFVYLKRKSETELFPSLPTDHSFRADSFVWSEFAAWFENAEIVNDVEVTGLYHYRCALNLYSYRFKTFPIALRNLFLHYELSILDKMSNFLFVGEANLVPETVWLHFRHVHPESEIYLREACTFYDEIMLHPKGFSEEKLKSMTYYYPRNIFVTDSNFGKEWLHLSFAIAQKLDASVRDTPNNRWGGFVLERLFTLFVEDFIENCDVQLRTYQQTYFVSVATWMKIQVLRIPKIDEVRKSVQLRKSGEVDK